MIFSELYGAYYTTMARIIERAIDHPLERGETRKIIEENAFGESVLTIEAAILKERWQLVGKDGTTPLKNIPTMPMTLLQKRWLKAISLDPRMKLFGESFYGLEDVEPLFTPEDYEVFDKYADGDDFEDPSYIRKFRLLLDAIRQKYPVEVITLNRQGRENHLVILPKRLEYSEKDDKFRLISSGRRYEESMNLGRILACERYTGDYAPNEKAYRNPEAGVVEFEVLDERNALERVLLHFAHFKKQVEKIEEGRYLVSITYERDDETEILIRILSFGPMVKVIGPKSFVKLIKGRLYRQKSCGQ